MYNYKVKTSFLKPKVKDLKKTGFNLVIVHFYIRRKLDKIQCYT